MLAIQIVAVQSEKRNAQKEMAVKLGAKAYMDPAKHIFVVHPDFKDFPIDRHANRITLKKIPETWTEI